MALKRLVFVLTALSLAAASFAADVGVFAYKCDGSYHCSIGQFADVADAVAHGYPNANVYNFWETFATSLNTALDDAYDDCENDGSCKDIYLDIETSLNLGGYKSVGDVVECNMADFKPLVLPGDDIVGMHVTGADGNVIRGFCFIGTSDVSFFDAGSGAHLSVQMENLHFEDAYVKTEGDGSRAAVVLHIASGKKFSNISVNGAFVSSNYITGGIVGLANVPEQADVPEYSNIDVDATLSGSIVGGVVGRFRDVDEGGRFSIADGKVKLKVNGKLPRKNDVIYVGGLVGEVSHSEPNNGVDLSLSGNQVDFDVDVSLPIGKAAFGGLVGKSGIGLGNISILGNEVRSAKIKVARQGDGQGIAIGGEIGWLNTESTESNLMNVKNERVNVVVDVDSDEAQYLGGIIGYMMWAPLGKGTFSGNNVHAEIGSKGESASIVAMGGLVAYSEESPKVTTPGMSLESAGDTLTLAMRTATTKDVRAGGLFGYLEISYEQSESGLQGSLLSDKEIVQAVSGKPLIEMTSSSVNYMYVGGLVGNYNGEASSITLQKSHVSGDIKAKYESNTSTYAGGIAGRILAQRGLVEANVSEGNIDIPAGVYLGYIVGSYAATKDDAEGLKALSNYHFGENDANAKNAIGFLSPNGSTGQVITWKTDGEKRNYTIHFNYRNAIDDETSPLVAEGKLDTLNAVPAKINKIYFDGIISEAEMKSRLFAYVLSENSSYYWENSESGLPYIAEDRTVYRIMIDVGDIYDTKLKNNEDVKPYLVEGVVGALDETKYLIEFTDKNGRASGLASLMNSLGLGTVDWKDKIPKSLGVPVTNDWMLKSVPDRKFKVRYQTENGVPIDVYMWPKVEEISLYYADDPVPAILLNHGGELAQYNLRAVEVEYGGVKWTPGVGGAYLPKSDVHNFSEITQVMLTHEHLDEFEDEIVLTYADAANVTEYVPEIKVRGGTTLTSFGYNEAGDLVKASEQSEGLLMASRIGIGEELGYMLKRWKVDFWMWNGDDESVLPQSFADCDGNVKICEEYTMSSNSFGNEDDIVKELSAYDSLRKENPPKRMMVQKRTFDLDASEMLDMDSFIKAASSFTLDGLKKKKSLLSVVSFLADVTPVLEAIPYNVTFDLNAGSHEVFIPDGFSATGVYSRGDPSTETFPKLYAKDVCLTGWGDKADNPSANQQKLDKNILGAVNPSEKDIYLYAQWKQCEKPPEMTSLTPIAQDKNAESGDFGDVSFWQSYVDANSETVRIDHGMEGGYLSIPVADEPMRFHVSAVPKEGYSLAKLFLVTEEFDSHTGVVIKSDSSRKEFYVNDTTISLTPSQYTSYKLYATFGRYYNAAYQLKRERDGVFFGIDSDADSVMIVEGRWVDLPRTIYTSDSCVLGWSAERNAKNWEYRDYVEADSIYDRLEPTKALYAVWADAQTCVDSLGYQLVKLETEHGMVQFLEKTFGADSTQYLHKFAENSTMLLPEKILDAYWIVRAAPQPGYALDSLVVAALEQQYNSESGLYEDKEIRFVLMAGDTLPSHIRFMSMQAFFSESKGAAEGPFQIVNANLRQSGDNGAAVRLDFETNPFNVSLDVSVNVSLLDVNGVLLREYDSVHVDETPYYGSWKEYPLTPGTYVLHVTLANDQYTVAFDTSFTVASEIKAAPNTWYMVSLGSVDMESVVWDDDPVFYWWDEFNLGGDYWQYNAFKSGNKVEGREQGYWYYSREGRPLKLAVDTANFVSEVNWQLDSVYSGWNLVANPYGWSVDIFNMEGLGYDSDRLCFNGHHGNPKDKDGEPEWTEIEFWKYDPASGSYGLADTVGPYEGVWVKTGCSKEWRFNAEPVFPEHHQEDNGGLLKAAKTPAFAEARDSWALQAKLGDGKGKVDAWNVLGVGAKNVVAAEPPEAMGDHVNLSVVDGKRHLAKSVKAGVAAPEWKVELSASSNRMGYLSFEGVDALREYGLKVFVTVDGKTTEMREGEPLKVALTRAVKYATVRVAESAKVELAYRLEGVRAFQVGHGLQVSFTATDGLAGSAVQVDLVDLKGHVVAKASGKALAGTNTLSLDAPKTGVYMLRVRAGSQVQTGRIMVK